MRTGGLVEALLLARVNEWPEADLETVALSPLVADTCRDAATVKADRPGTLRIQPGVTALGNGGAAAQPDNQSRGQHPHAHTPTPPCTVELHATTARRTDRPGRGPGIPKPAVAHVFDRVHSADKGRSRTHGGSGLGLSIVAAITELHHARIRLDSSAGQGTRLDVLFPRHDAYQAP